MFFGYEFFRVGAYIVADSFQFVATGNDDLKITTQPKVAGIISLVRFVIAYPCDGNERFIGAYDTSQGWRILGKAIKPDNKMHMVWHDDKFILSN